MLTTLTLLRSCTYDLAELDFRRGKSMQLVGGNNAGKSSIIYALNFLFVIHRNRMSFSAGKKADKVTMEYYFPEAEGSFIIFEIHKRGKKYCIVVWRDGEMNPQYARLQHAYDRTLFCTETADGALIPEKLTALKKKWVAAGIQFEPLRNQREVFQTVYHTGRNNNAAVWLKNSGHGNAGRGFSQLYRYLIDTRLIDMNALREILLLADHREDTALQYGTSSLGTVDRLRRMQTRVHSLRAAEEDFNAFRENYRVLAEDRERLVHLSLHFSYHCTRVRAQIQSESGRHEEDLTTAEQDLERSEADLREAQKSIGATTAQLEGKGRRATELDQRITAIAALPDAAFLTQAITNLRETTDAIRLQLADLKRNTEPVPSLEKRRATLTDDLAARRRERANVEHWLIHHLAGSDTDRRRLLALLSVRITRADAGLLNQPLTTTDGPVRLFDGSFEWPADLPLPDLTTPEALDAEIAEISTRLNRLDELLITARDQEKLRADLDAKIAALHRHEDELRRREEGPDLRERRAAVDREIKDLTDRRATAETTARQHEETVRRRRDALTIIREKAEARRRGLQQLDAQQRRVEDMKIITDGYDYSPRPLVDDQLTKVFNELDRQHRAVEKLSFAVGNDFRALRQALLSETASEEAFIEEVTGELAALEDRTRSIASLVDNISQTFATPAADLLNEYRKFGDFITKQFNRGLARRQISNVTGLRIELVDNERLHDDLRRISGLDLGGNGLFQRDGGGMKILKRYIEQGKAITFSDLFTLQLKLTVNGREKTVDLSKQIESDGTDRMLRLVIVMQVISRLVELGPDNKVVVFIDEIATIDGKNRPQLVRFCAENHFYPIFAAPEMVEGFDRYVMISRSADGALVVDRHKHYIDAERD